MSAFVILLNNETPKNKVGQNNKNMRLLLFDVPITFRHLILIALIASWRLELSSTAVRRSGSVVSCKWSRRYLVIISTE